MAGPQAELPRTPESPGGVQVIARVGQMLRALDGEANPGTCSQAIAIRGSTGALLAISVPVPTQRYWALEDRITRVLLDARKEALAALDPPAAYG